MVKTVAIAITECQPELDSFLAKYFPQPTPVMIPSPNGYSPSLEDNQVLFKGMEAENGQKLKNLWEGDTSNYPSPSEADLAFVGIVAFYTQDLGQIDRLYRKSSLFRPKWDEAHGDKTYGEITITKALSTTTAHYKAKAEADLALRPNWPQADRPRPKFEFRTAKQIAQETPENPEWLIPGYVAIGSITEVDGKIKSSGKTTFLTHAARRVVAGEDFLGKPTIKSPVIYLTEQGKGSFREALRRADLLDREDFHVLNYPDTIGTDWPPVVETATKKAVETGAKLLVVDTLPQWAKMRGEEENHTGNALEALEPLQLAASLGIGVVVIRHERKSGGEPGESGRGSSAFGGGVDIITNIRRGDGATPVTVRVLHSLSRFDETPDKLVINYQDGQYISLGTLSQVATAQGRAAILAAAPSSEGEAKKTEDLLTDAEVKPTLGKDVIAQLFKEGRLFRIGSGKKGDPYCYWESGFIPPEGYVVPAESNPDEVDWIPPLYIGEVPAE